MGTDIHLVVERRQPDGVWERVPFDSPGPNACHHRKYREGCFSCGKEWTCPETNWYHGRNYELFGALAGVRGRYDEGPLIPLRGLPNPLYPVEGNGDDGEPSLGDHSYSWWLASELFAVDWAQELGNDNFQGSEWASFLDVLRGVGPPDEVRIVFGFDS